MDGRGNPFSQDYSTDNSSESSLFHNPIPEEGGREHLYSVNNEVVNNLRRHTRAYVKNIGGFPIIPELPRREYKRKYCPILEDSVLVGDWEELVEIALQDYILPLNQEGPDTPHSYPAHTYFLTSSLSTQTHSRRKCKSTTQPTESTTCLESQITVVPTICQLIKT